MSGRIGLVDVKLVASPVGFHRLGQLAVERGCVCFVRKIRFGFLKTQRTAFLLKWFGLSVKTWPVKHPPYCPGWENGLVFIRSPYTLVPLCGPHLNLVLADRGNRNWATLPARDPRMKFLHFAKTSQWGPSFADGIVLRQCSVFGDCSHPQPSPVPATE